MLIRKMKTKNQDKRITTYVLITTLQLKNTLRHNLPRLNVYIVLQFEKKKKTQRWTKRFVSLQTEKEL